MYQSSSSSHFWQPYKFSFEGGTTYVDDLKGRFKKKKLSFILF